MKKFDEIIESLPQRKRAIFGTGDAGVSKMQQELSDMKSKMWQEKKIVQREYQNPNGVFLRFSLNGVMHSGIIETENRSEMERR